MFRVLSWKCAINFELPSAILRRIMKLIPTYFIHCISIEQYIELFACSMWYVCRVAVQFISVHCVNWSPLIYQTQADVVECHRSNPNIQRTSYLSLDMCTISVLIGNIIVCIIQRFRKCQMMKSSIDQEISSDYKWCAPYQITARHHVQLIGKSQIREKLEPSEESSSARTHLLTLLHSIRSMY